jgi:hypothetical protein
MVIDTACQTTVAGDLWLNRRSAALQELGLTMITAREQEMCNTLSGGIGHQWASMGRLWSAETARRRR